MRIEPKTYNDAVRLSKCLKLRDYIIDITDKMLEEMYMHLSASKKNVIGASDGQLYLINDEGDKVSVYSYNKSPNATYDRIVVSDEKFSVINSQSDSSDSGCGCGSNNNNNNNNNNG